ncbi:MAG: hypothetical protein LBR61_02705 [Synergistaceae bacterium]|jgi:hypothetical protein|nr:hypothetical protein [Synergistaceae bacterium]
MTKKRSLPTRFPHKIFFRKLVLCLAGAALLYALPSFADAREDAERIFALNAKLRPGTSLNVLNQLLGPPANEHRVTGMENLILYTWLHGEMGVEIYCTGDVAHRVSITLPLPSEREVPRALDAITRRGRSQYGVMPAFDRTTGEYYWTGGGVRFGFSKYNARTVRSTCIALR